MQSPVHGSWRPAEAGVKRRLRTILVGLARKALRPYAEQQRQLSAGVGDVRADLDTPQRSVAEDRRTDVQRFGRVETLLEDLIATVETLRRRGEKVELRWESELVAIRQRIKAADAALRSELYALPYLAGSPFEQFRSPVGDVIGYRSAPQVGGPGTGYPGFEDLFRGPTARVTEAQRAYLPLVTDHQPVLDVGCGRGEFLALLAGESIQAFGVDSDPGMIERCRAHGLAVQLGDAVEYLESLEDGSLGCVFSAQVVEHLPLAKLNSLLDLALAKLAPGGTLIAETVNPHSLPAFKTFWVDLTHRHPIFPEAALAMCALAGFAPAYVFAPGHPSFEPVRFTANTYAVVASAPEGQP
jgi:SAM-dependent methyltransferase